MQAQDSRIQGFKSQNAGKLGRYKAANSSLRLAASKRSGIPAFQHQIKQRSKLSEDPGKQY